MERVVRERWDFPNQQPNAMSEWFLLSRLGSLPGQEPPQHSEGPGALLSPIVLLPVGRKALREVASKEEGL